jgi:lambda repressor-like predicted transcriptional regulator
MDRTGYEPERFSKYLKTLLQKHGLSMRKASLEAGLNHSSVGGFVRGRRPHRDSCLILAEYFHVDPNEMLEAAGYEPMPVVDRSLIDPQEFAPEVKEFAAELMRFAPQRRRDIITALRTLLKTSS